MNGRNENIRDIEVMFSEMYLIIGMFYYLEGVHTVFLNNLTSFGLIPYSFISFLIRRHF